MPHVANAQGLYLQYAKLSSARRKQTEAAATVERAPQSGTAAQAVPGKANKRSSREDARNIDIKEQRMERTGNEQAMGRKAITDPKS